MLVEDRALMERAAEIETLLEEIETFPDPAMRAKALETIQGLLLLYGEGLARIVTIVQDEENARARERVLGAFARDDLVSHLLLLHDLHPVPLEARVLEALEDVRPYLQSHGGNVELLEIRGGVARLRLQGSCQGCPSSTMTLKLAIEEAIRKAAPELEGIEADGAAEPVRAAISFLPTSELRKTGAAEGRGAMWKPVGDLHELVDGGIECIAVSGAPVLFCRLGSDLYAYRDACPRCEAGLRDAALRGTELECRGCGLRYDVQRAGRCLDAPDLHLEPVPLLVRDGTVRVALDIPLVAM